MKSFTKITTGVLTAVTLMGVGAISVPTNANAATWHKGTPKVMQGTWKNKEHQTFKITKSGFYYGAKEGTIKTTYKYAGHHKYYVKAPGTHMSITVTRHHMKYAGDNWTK